MSDIFDKLLVLIKKVWNSGSSKGTKWEMSYSEWKYPKWLDASPVRYWTKWMEGKRDDDGAEGLWRVHDGLYDLDSWIDKHPGGKMWIESTRGTDITEAFEAHHINKTAEAMLSKFHIRKASTPRNSPFTFHPDGFYKTLKGRIRERLSHVERGPSNMTKLLTDGMALLALTFALSAVLLKNYFLIIPASFFLTSTVIAAHNFFHQRDNWRMYYFNFSLMSSRDWRVSHAMSHHIYPNTVLDLEVTMFDPIFQWLPKHDKTIVARYLSWLYAPIAYAFIFHVQWLTRIILKPDGFFELIPFTLPAIMLCAGFGEILYPLLMWHIMIHLASFFFGLIGINAAHHHPDLFHDGDKPREDRDWGLFQLDAVRDRAEIIGLLPLVLILFGDHSLHHLFPTIDHSILWELYPILEETCKEFNYDFKLTSAPDLIKGQFLQLARIEPKFHAGEKHMPSEAVRS